MTYLQMWKAFNRMCPLRYVSDWRPFGPRQIIVWFEGKRDIKAVKVHMVDEFNFDIHPATNEEWLKFETDRVNDGGIPAVGDKFIFRKDCNEC